MLTDLALQHLASIQTHEVVRYSDYLMSIQPITYEDKFRRWLFAFASVHTSWKLNCKLYQALSDLKWIGDSVELKRRIQDTGAGLHNNRMKFISEFTQFYWDHPTWFTKSIHEDWYQYRDRIKDAAKGIGIAKSAFVTELLYPMDTRVLCVDTHVIQMYGYHPEKISKKQILEIERHWDESCSLWNIPTTIARWIFWDRKAGYADSRFWSYVFEGPSVRNNT